MKTFALITEGITDQVVLRIVLESYYGMDEVEIVPLQPELDATDEARQAEDSHGGWENVLNKCSLFEKVSEALSLNDYLVIQIDTDVCEKKNFDVSYRVNGRERTVDELVEAVREKLISKIDESLYNNNAGKFIFAVAVHSLECWLLPAYGGTNAAKRKITGCEGQLKEELRRRRVEYAKDYEIYVDISSVLKRKKDLLSCVGQNRSFEIFLKSLPLPE